MNTFRVGVSCVWVCCFKSRDPVQSTCVTSFSQPQAWTPLHLDNIVVPPEMHDAILSERFHRYMNKIQTTTQADTQSYEQWKMGTLFATYAWNASPVDGLDVIRSFAAKARTFRFPLDIARVTSFARLYTGTPPHPDNTKRILQWYYGC